MESFRQFMEQNEKISPELGLQELTRLGQSHFFVTVPAESEEIIQDYLHGKDGLRYIDPKMVRTVEEMKQIAEPYLVVAIPRRWFKKNQLENQGIHGAISQLIPFGKGWKIPQNYIWGYFADGNFHRHYNYHAHDGLYNRWQEQIPKKPPIPVDRSRVVAPYSLPTYKIWHGYNEKSFG
jgi:hypothetical protein